MRWKKVKLSDAMEVGGPGKRWGHTFNAVQGGKLLYLFGGYGRDNCQTNQVHVFDTVSQSWSQPFVMGQPPTPRDSHSCTTVGNHLFVFGGTDGVNPLRDLHILDTASNTWITPNVRGEAPEPREGHTAALIGKRIFIFGGCGKSRVSADEVYYNDLFILNTETFVWQHAVTSGTPPSARDSHTCSSWGSKLIVIGGEDGHEYYLNDVHVLDTDNLVWSELNASSGHLFPPRAGHSAVAFDKYLFVFGGFSDEQNLYDDLHMLDVDAGTWTKILATGDGPSARFSMAGDCLDPTICGALVFIGGCNKSLEALDDMYFLYTDLLREFGRDDRRLEKLSLRKQLKMKCQERYLPASSNDKALVPYGSPDLHESGAYSQHGPQHIHLNDYRPTIGKRTFHAKVTKNLGNGFTIETIIDGRPLRGILFSDKPLTPMTGPIPTRNPSGEINAGADQSTPKDQVKLNNDQVKSNNDQEPKTDLSIPKDPQKDTVSAANEHGLSVPDKSGEVAAGTLVPNLNLGLDSNQVSEKNYAIPEDTIKPTSQGEKNCAENAEQIMAPSSETH